MASRAKNGQILVIPDFVREGVTVPCSTVDPELFFPQEIEIGNKIISKYANLSYAKEICANCPLRAECLEYALRNIEIGIWGGTTEAQREGIRRSSRIRTIKRSPSPTLW